MKISISMNETALSPEGDLLMAHCTLEFDDESAIAQDNEAFQHKIHAAIIVCCRAVHEALHP